ncbi:hypothetical protein LEN26_009670 [Aphanomyces euteiches]|nr:hypothetical protein LEN26_009670 [Aphanomyces euteiches]KAH9127756.1 hypothetical protein AeMF1_001974 [Aphanomyces euteiches]KAH9186590.1 hypothetical protein AeNC1_011438 [Aphanomyces euteiches]
MRFDFSDIPALNGKVAIVTGASSGIGLVTARELAKKHCHVILACRSKTKTEPVIKTIQEAAPEANVEFMELDLMSLKSVQAFTDAFKARGLPLHLLINNAGIAMVPFALTKDGIELQFGTNHIAHMALTLRLLPILETSAPSRIVNVSSMSHAWASADGFDWDKINNPETYSTWRAYGLSKLANVLFTRELSRRLHARGIQNVYVNALHPGSVYTGIAEGYNFIVRFFAKLVLSSADNGAKTQLYVATHQDIVTNNWHGQYFVPIAELSETHALGQDTDLASRLWDLSLEFINKTIQD